MFRGTPCSFENASVGAFVWGQKTLEKVGINNLLHITVYP